MSLKKGPDYIRISIEEGEKEEEGVILQPPPFSLQL